MMGASTRTASAWDGFRTFFGEFRRHFHTTGAIAPSGAQLARAITAPLGLAPSGGLRILEVGAGTGVFTTAILQHLGRGDALEIFEINPAFRPFLQARLEVSGALQRGVACRLHIASITELAAGEKFDFMVSGLPLNNFTAAEVEALLALFMAHLRPGGVLSYFEYLFIRDMKLALIQNAAEQARLRAVGAVVTEFLGRYPHQEARVAWNLPPAVAHHVCNAQANGWI